MTSQMILLILIFIPISMTLAVIPFVTRKTENFGVSIPASMYERDEFKIMRKKYAFFTVIAGFVFIGLLLIIGYTFTVHPDTMGIIVAIFTFVYLMISFLIYLPFHLNMKKIKEKENWQTAHKQAMVVDTKFRQEKLVHSNWWFLIPTAIILVTVGMTFMLYDKIPNQIPMHTDFTGNIRYDTKSIGNLLFLPGTQLFMVFLFIFLNYIIKTSKQQVNAENPEVSKQQNILFRRRWSFYLIVTLILTTLMFSFIQMTFIYPQLSPYENHVLFTTIGIILVGTIIFSIKTGQGGSRIKLKDELNKNVMNHDDDVHWKLGQFYFNKNDPSIFVEKRFGVGWTNNWAHPLSWIFLILIIGLAVAVPLFITIL